MARAWAQGRHSRGAALGLLLLLLSGCGTDEGAGRRAYDADGRLPGGFAVPAHAPNLLVIVVDSLRADAIQNTPGGGPAMPTFARLAEQGVRFEQAAASAPWTLPSMVSLLTGLLPSLHGLVSVRSGHVLVPAVTTFAEVLQNAFGYQTAAFVAGPWLYAGPRSNVLQGFGTMEPQFSLRGVASQVGAWARGRDPARPFFLLLHTYDVHAPYGESNHAWPLRPSAGGRLTAEAARALTPAMLHRIFALDWDAIADVQQHLGDEGPARSHLYAFEGFRRDPDRALASELESAYWDGVRWADGLLAEALSELKQLHLLDNTLLVVTSDHGETFGEHGTLGHGLQLHDDLVRVPLVLKGPAPFDRPATVAHSVALIDVLPTFLDLAGLPPLGGIQGRSCLPVLRGEEAGRGVLLEETLDRHNTGLEIDRVLLGVRTAAWKYVLDLDRQSMAVREVLYDLAADPGEVVDLLAGRGPFEALVLDAPTCEAVARIQRRVWRTDSSPSDAGGGFSIPYGTPTAAAPQVPPRPCKAGPR